MNPNSWACCLAQLESELSAQQFNTWIRPLSAIVDGELVQLLAPNHFVRDWVSKNFINRISNLLAHYSEGQISQVLVLVGNGPVLHEEPPYASATQVLSAQDLTSVDGESNGSNREEFDANEPDTDKHNIEGPNPESMRTIHGVRSGFTFTNFVEGKSNQLAKAASVQVAENPGDAYNPLFLYGGVGLGKTHLMQAIGNAIKSNKPHATVVYLHSERFVGDMVKALQHNAINEFKRFYRSVDALLIDDIQFFAGKERSQEEFFHTFNALLEDQQQVVLTCDRYPKEVDGLEERLKSRFGWGLTVAIEPPELETRVAILKQKAEQIGVAIPDDVAFFVGQRIRSNVRELEGALRRVIANARFTGRPINHELAKDALRDLLALQDKLVTIENIQKTVAHYYKVRVADLTSKRRSRSIARPRQVAMALAKELTSHSLPEIGDAFGGRDHTTVLHATRKITELRQQDLAIEEDYTILLRTLSS